MRSAFQRGNIVFWLLGYMNMPMVYCQIKGEQPRPRTSDKLRCTRQHPLRNEIVTSFKMALKR